MEDQALKEINELKARVNNLLKACKLYGDCIDFESIDLANEADTIMIMSPAQCLKQHDLDLLNSIKDEFINSNQSCELILESRINSLELENE